jgi:hypothetical protein
VTTEFVVENAGCVSCGALVRDALSAVGTVERLDVEETADVATVRLASAAPFSLEDIDGVLDAASAGSGHRYRVRPGSWAVQTTG